MIILYKGSRGRPLFSGGGGGGGGVSNFFPGGGEGGPNANFYRNTYMYLLFSRGSVRTPIPLWIHTWAMSSYRDNINHIPASNHNCQALICQD